MSYIFSMMLLILVELMLYLYPFVTHNALLVMILHLQSVILVQVLTGYLPIVMFASPHIFLLMPLILLIAAPAMMSVQNVKPQLTTVPVVQEIIGKVVTVLSV